jgi:plasmid stabilization system protein ParE
MALKVSWSPEAVADAAAIAESIVRDSPVFAKTVFAKLFNASRNLGNFPSMGRLVPGIEDNAVREMSLYNYRLIYRIEKYQVLIVAIVHGKRP